VRARAFSSPSAFLGILLRGTEIVWELTMFFLSLSYDKLVGLDERNVPTRAAQLRRLLCRLGPSFIKSGQVLANRPDIIREDYMNELCILQDDVPAFPTQEAFAIIEANMGVPLEETFSAISPEPVAAASLGQVYRARLRASGAEVAVKVLRPGIEPVIYRDLFLFRTLASFLNGISIQKLGCNAELIVDEFGEKLLEELDYRQEARNIQSFYENFLGDPTVKIPLCYAEMSGERVLVMEWIDGIRCTDPQAIRAAGIDTEVFLTVGVSAALRQLLEFGLFHGDPHPGNIFAMRDGRIAYVDFGNVAELSQYNKEILIDAIVHAVNEDYVEMAGDFTRLGFLAPGTDVTPIVPALEAIWQNSTGQSLADFNFRTVTRKFNQLVYNFPIRIPERFSLVIRSLLTQEGICLSLEPNFKFLEVAYPYVAKRLLTDPDPALRSRLIQVLFKDGVFQWKRLENLITLAKEQVALANRARHPDGTVTAVAAAATPAPAAVVPNSRFFPLDPASFGFVSWCESPSSFPVSSQPPSSLPLTPLPPHSRGLPLHSPTTGASASSRCLSWFPAKTYNFTFSLILLTPASLTLLTPASLTLLTPASLTLLTPASLTLLSPASLTLLTPASLPPLLSFHCPPSPLPSSLNHRSLSQLALPMHAPCTNTIVFLLPHPPSSPSLPPPPLALITNLRSLSQLALPILAPAFLTGFSATGPARAATSAASAVADGGLDLRETIRDGARVLLMDPGLRRQLLLAFTQDSRLHVKEVRQGKKRRGGGE
ncbi:unnamed protein product, partial [Closterium sp. Naga37s-1]